MSPKKIAVTVTYTSTGAQPPIYLAGSFSNWHPEEMDFSTDSDNEYHFAKVVTVEEGKEFQYKFRIGPGDWWVLNENSPTVTDELGNRNNLLTILLSEDNPTESYQPESTAPPLVMEKEADPISLEPETVSHVGNIPEHPLEHIEAKAEASENESIATPPVMEKEAEPIQVEPEITSLAEKTSEHSPEDIELHTEPSQAESTVTPVTEKEADPRPLEPETTSLVENVSKHPPDHKEVQSDPSQAEPTITPVMEKEADSIPLEPETTSLVENVSEHPPDHKEVQAEPSQAEPSQAEPSQAEPSQAEPSQAEPTITPVMEKEADSIPLEPETTSLVENVSEHSPDHIKVQVEPSHAESATRPPVIKTEADLIRIQSDTVSHLESTTEYPAEHIVAEAEPTVAEHISPSTIIKNEPMDSSHVEEERTALPPNDPIVVPTVPGLEVFPSSTSDHMTSVEENIGESSGSELILTPSTTGEKEEPVATEEIGKEPLESSPIPPRAHTPIPEVIVEKVDNEPRHGDDFGEDATSGQKKAHEMRAEDAEPDLVIINPEISTESETAAEVANTAASLDEMDIQEGTSTAYSAAEDENDVEMPHEIASQVADSAAILDKEEPEPLLSDEEAGRIGERRLSHTPIPEVARTASEVADTAAVIDADTSDVPRFKFVDPDSGSASGTTTPAHEMAPLFAHEMPAPYEENEDHGHETVPVEPPQNHMNEETLLDTDDPTLEAFPSDRESILHTVRSCSSRLDVDETHFEGSPSSPVVGQNSFSGSGDLEEPAAVLLDTPSRSNASAQPSPVLDVIKEENSGADDMVELPSPGKTEESKNELLEKELPPGTTVAVQQVDDEPMTPSKDPQKDDSIEESSPGAGSVIALPVIAQEPEYFNAQIAPGKSSETDTLPTETITSTTTKPELSETESSQPEAGSIPAIESVVTQQEVLTDTSSSVAPSKPVVSDGETFNKDLGAAGNDGPEIVVQPATPGTIEDDPRDINTAKSTSAESGTNGNNVKMRIPPPVKRTSTPTSLGSPRKDREAHNIFAAIWQTVFVSWIGGLLKRFCGGRRRP